MEQTKHDQRTDVRHSAIEFSDTETAQNDDPSDEDDDAKTLSTVLSRLQTVRVPGRGRVDPEETIAAAIAQAKAFQRWCDDGTPVGEIELWVEGNRVMSALPEPPAQLQEFKFSVPSPDNSVLQVTSQTHGERTVLYNLLLRDVPADGLLHEEEWPSGQSMSLQIMRQAVAAAAAGAGSATLERFAIRVAINCREINGNSETTISRNQSVWGNRSDERKTPANRNAFRTKALAAASSVVTRYGVVLLFVCLALPMALVGKTNSIKNELQKERVRLLAENASLRKRAEEVQTENYNPPTIQRTEANDRLQSKGLTDISVRKANYSESNEFSPASAIEVKNSMTETHQIIDDASPAFAVTVYPKLAGLKNLYVRMDTQTEPARLKSSFERALQATDSFNVLAESDQAKADGVITLRFEHSTSCVGVVFAKVTGPDGKFLWEGYKWEAPRVCLTIPTSQDKMFDDASTVLVDRLEKTVRYAQVTTKESSVDGG